MAGNPVFETVQPIDIHLVQVLLQLEVTGCTDNLHREAQLLSGLLPLATSR